MLGRVDLNPSSLEKPQLSRFRTQIVYVGRSAEAVERGDLCNRQRGLGGPGLGMQQGRAGPADMRWVGTTWP